MFRTIVFSALCLAAAAPAFAQDQPRLVTGGLMPAARFSGPDVKAPLVSAGGLTLGALADSTPVSEDASRLAGGGYVAYAIDKISLTSSARGDATASGLDLGASYAGTAGTAAVKLGYEWAGRPSSFSPNPMQMAPVIEPASDLSLTLSFTHDITPSLQMGGFAAATRSEYEDRTTQQGFKLGAGMGLRF